MVYRMADASTLKCPRCGAEPRPEGRWAYVGRSRWMWRGDAAFYCVGSYPRFRHELTRVGISRLHISHVRKHAENTDPV